MPRKRCLFSFDIKGAREEERERDKGRVERRGEREGDRESVEEKGGEGEGERQGQRQGEGAGRQSGGGNQGKSRIDNRRPGQTTVGDTEEIDFLAKCTQLLANHQYCTTTWLTN